MKIIISLVLAFSVLIVLLLDGRVNNRSDLAIFEDMTGAKFCSSGGIISFGDVINEINKNTERMVKKNSNAEVIRRDIILRSFDHYKYPCMKMDGFDINKNLSLEISDRIVKNSGLINIDKFNVTLVVTRSKNFNRNSIGERQLIYVRVPGGPGGYSIYSNFDNLIDYNSGAVAIDFFYRGNSFNMNYPDPSFDVAKNGLKAFLLQLRKRNKTSKIVLVGESFGAALSVATLNELDSEYTDVVDRVVLLSPPFGSLNETADNLERLSSILSKNDRYALYRLRDATYSGGDYGKLVYLDWIEVFRKFYTPREGAIDLYDRIKLIDRTKILIVYGSEDDRISVEKAGMFYKKNRPNVEMFLVNGMGHEFNNFLEAADIKAEIDIFVN